MKPDWKDAPEWAQWLAVDEDGAWYWYEDEPQHSGFKDEWRNWDRFERASINNWRDVKEPRP